MLVKDRGDGAEADREMFRSQRKRNACENR